MERFRNILLYVEPAKGDSAAFTRAVNLCRVSGAKLRLLAVTPELSVYLRYPQFSYPSLEETLIAEAQEGLTGLAAYARAQGVDVSTTVRHGKPFLAITREALSGEHDLVMLAAPAAGAARTASTAMGLFRVCPRPVWAVRETHAGPFQRVLAAVDPSTQESDEHGLNTAILDQALSLATAEKARVDVLHAWSGASDYGEAIAALREEIGVVALESLTALVAPYNLPVEQVHLVEGDPAAVIPDFVEGNDIGLLVMGTVVRTGIAGLLIGNTAEKVLNKVDCSVLALKPAGFVTPIEVDPDPAG